MNWCSKTLKLLLVLSLMTGHQFAFSNNRCVDIVSQPNHTWYSPHQAKSWNYLNQFKEFIELMKQAENTNLNSLNETKFLNVLKKILLGHYTEISNSEFQSLSLNVSQQNIVKALLNLRGSAEYTVFVVPYLMTYWSGRLSSPMLFKEESALQKAKLSLQAIYNGPFRFLFPFLPLPKWHSAVNSILEKKFFNPGYEPTPQEITTLKKYSAYDTYLRNVYVQSSHPNWNTFRRMMSYGFIAAMTANTFVVANWALHLFGDDSFVNTEQFLSESKYRLNENQVRIYNETVPFPHMAIEIDDKVYSYGMTHLNVTSAVEYLSSDEMYRLILRQIPEASRQRPTQNNGSIRNSYESISLQKLAEVTGLDKSIRSVQMITLNLKKSEKEKLKRYLQMSEFKKYRNSTLVMDCASMIMIALKNSTSTPIPIFGNIPLTVDASPSSMMMYFGLLKSLGIKNENGEALVGDIRQVTRASELERSYIQKRNLYINAMEAKIFMAYFGYNAAQRSYLNIRYGEEEFQFLEPEVRSELIKMQQAVQDELTDLKSDNEIALQVATFLDEAREVSSNLSQKSSQVKGERYQNLMKLSDYFFSQELEKVRARANSTNSSFRDVVVSSYREQILLAFQIHIKNVAEGKASYLKVEDPQTTLDRLLSQ